MIAISPEQPELAALMEAKHQLEFDILFDNDNTVARKFGLVFQLPEPLRSIYKTFGTDLVKYNGNQNFELPLPATYLVDCNGIVQFAFVYADYRKRLEPELLVTEIQKLNAKITTPVVA